MLDLVEPLSGSFFVVDVGVIEANQLAICLLDRRWVGIAANTQHGIMIAIEFHYLTQACSEQDVPVSLANVPEEASPWRRG